MLLGVVRGLIFVVIGIYLIALVMVVLFSDQLIFQPQQAGYRDNAGILKLTSSGGGENIRNIPSESRRHVFCSL